MTAEFQGGALSAPQVAMLAAGRGPSGGRNLHDHAPPALRAVTRWFKRKGGFARAVRAGLPAAAAELIDHSVHVSYNFLDLDLSGLADRLS